MGILENIFGKRERATYKPESSIASPSKNIPHRVSKYVKVTGRKGNIKKEKWVGPEGEVTKKKYGTSWGAPIGKTRKRKLLKLFYKKRFSKGGIIQHN